MLTTTFANGKVSTVAPSDDEDIEISDQATTILGHRYFLKDTNGVVTEDTAGLFRRVAKNIASIENYYLTLPVEADLLANDFFSMMSKMEFIPNSPTLMNAGTDQGTLSACFVLPLEDSMEGIMKAASDAAMVQKFGGGTGFSLSKIRPQGSSIKTTHGIACGPIEVLKTLSRVSSMITQGGKRDGANMAVMSIYHPDILSFINCKTVEGDIHNFNISVGVDSRWMELVQKGADYPLIDPHTNQIVGYLNALTIFKHIVEGAWQNGEPGMVFLDRINADNHVVKDYGPMLATNPCGEQPLLANESCNLGSINLSKFYKEGWLTTTIASSESWTSFGHPESHWKKNINWEHLEEVTKLAVRFLDNVIDRNVYVTSDIETMTKATRKIGLGIMGFADLLIQLRIPYNSDAARVVGSEIMSRIREWSDEASLELGAARGTFPAWKNSDYNKTTEIYRNSCRLTVAPTGTISMIADTSSGIEPTFALAWTKQNIMEGKTLNYINKYFELDAKKYGFYSDNLMEYLADGGSLQNRSDVPEWTKQVYVTAPEILPEDHILMQAAFQTHVDSGISKTINFAHTALVEDVEKAYWLAWNSGCKGVTVYRAGSRVKEVLTKGTIVVRDEEPSLSDKCCETPYIVMESGCEICKSCGWSACIIA